VANKLIREVTTTYIAGTPGRAGSPAYCYTRTIRRQVSGGSVGVASTFIPASDLSSGNSIRVNGFAAPVFRQVSPYTDASGNRVTQELSGYNVLRGAPSTTRSPSYTTTEETVCVPAVPAIPSIPAEVVQVGGGPDWRASARSIATITGDGVATFRTKQAPRIIIGFATEDSGANQADIRMGIQMYPVTGGALVVPILNGSREMSAGIANGTYTISLVRVHGRFKVFRNATLIYDAPSQTEQPVFLDAMLYTSDDYIEDPAFAEAVSIVATGSVGIKTQVSDAFGVSGSVGFSGALNLLVDGQAAFSAAGGIGFEAQLLVVGTENLSATGAVGFTATLDLSGLAGGDLTMSRIGMLASDFVTGTSSMAMAAMSVEGYAGEGELEVAGFDKAMTPMLLSALMYTGGLIESETAMAPMAMLASDSVYGGGSVTLNPMAMYADDGFGVANYYGHNEPVEIADTITTDPSIIATWTDGIDLTPEMSIAVVLSGTTIDGVLLDDLNSVSGIIQALVNSGVNLASATQVPFNALAQFAFDIGTGAATRYDNFEFTQFAYTPSGTYAIKPDGVYVLRKGDDDGESRSALVDFGDTAFGVSAKKHIHTMFLGVSGDGTIYVKLSADGKNYKTYRVVGQQPTKRVRTAKGITAREWGTRLEWVDSTDIELDAVEFVLAGSSRRWTR